MRKYLLLVLPLIAVAIVPVGAQQKGKNPYKVEFEQDRDVEQLDRDTDGTKGIFIRVRFAITLEGASVGKVEGNYKLLIEENGKQVKVVDVPKPVLSDALAVSLAMDTSARMQEPGRIEQARGAAATFLQKLPARSECGLILFDREIRSRQDPIYKREPLLKLINTMEPRGGTAWIDATSAGIKMVRTVRGREGAVVLMTDGIDLNSKRTIQQVIDEAHRNGKIDVRIYTIGIGEPGRLLAVNTVLVLDHSGSMTPPADDADTTPKIEALHEAAERYVDSISNVARVSIIPFNTMVGRAEPFRTKAPKELALLKQSIKKLRPEGETALLDACYDAVNVLEADDKRGKRAVVGMTDGVDNSSRRRVEEVIERAKDAQIPLFLIGFGRAGEIDDATMKQMADATGGRYYHARNKKDLVGIFEDMSILLHDDGIDEKSLKLIAEKTGGQYFLAKDVKDLKMVFEKVTQQIQREAHEIVFPSLNQRADGSQRNVTLKLVELDAEGRITTVLEEKEGSYQTRGLVVAEMNHFVYLVLLAVVGGLIALPGLLRRAAA